VQGWHLAQNGVDVVEAVRRGVGGSELFAGLADGKADG
jgi:hypothetical protein